MNEQRRSGPSATRSAAISAGGAGAGAGRACYFGGDWSQLGELLMAGRGAGSFDLVVTAETVYSPPSTRTLLACIKQVTSPSSCAGAPGRVVELQRRPGRGPPRGSRRVSKPWAACAASAEPPATAPACKWQAL